LFLMSKVIRLLSNRVACFAEAVGSLHDSDTLGMANGPYYDFGTWFNLLFSMSLALSTKSASVMASSRSNMAS
jgi:hypothetical protein